MRNIFKRKKKEWKNPWGGSVNSEWWQKLVGFYKKDIDPNADPEKDAQEIYHHWIRSYLSK